MNPGPKSVRTKPSNDICMTARNRGVRTNSCRFMRVSNRASRIMQAFSRGILDFAVRSGVTCLCGCSCHARSSRVGIFGLGTKGARQRGFVASNAAVHAPCDVDIGPCDKGICVASTCSCGIGKSILYFDPRKRLVFGLPGIKVGSGAILFQGGTSRNGPSRGPTSPRTNTFTGGMLRCGPTPSRCVGASCATCRRKFANVRILTHTARLLRSHAAYLFALKKFKNGVAIKFSRAVPGIPNRCSFGVCNGTCCSVCNALLSGPKKGSRPKVILMSGSAGNGKLPSSR